ncbi:MAG: low temperature requirement protein A [Micromonosporaceae bacterium]
MAVTGRRPLLRVGPGAGQVTNVELFFDLVYVFAITQLSHHLLGQPTVQGALQTALLLALVWLAWVYTTWVTNWLDPRRISVRLLLVTLMLLSLVMSASLPDAFGSRGLAVGAAYAAMQIGRSAFTVAALPGHALRRNFERILAWCMVSGTLAVAGGIAHGHARELLWLLAVAVDLGGGAVGFYTPGLGRSATREWNIQGSHFAERCQAFVLIALGESVIVIGATLSGLASVTSAEVAAFVAAFAGCVALWWVYFDRTAEAGAGVIAASPDPGRLGRSAYHSIHPIMVAGIIVAAAADQNVLSHPATSADTATAWMVLGGSALFLAGHAAFKATVWRVVPWSRIAAIVLLALMGLLAPHVPAAALSGCAAAVVIAVALADRYQAGAQAGARATAGDDSTEAHHPEVGSPGGP